MQQTGAESPAQHVALLQVKRTCYAQSSQIRQIRKKMVEIMTREASSCDLKELVGKFIPEAIGELLSMTGVERGHAWRTCVFHCNITKVTPMESEACLLTGPQRVAAIFGVLHKCRRCLQKLQEVKVVVVGCWYTPFSTYLINHSLSSPSA